MPSSASYKPWWLSVMEQLPSSESESDDDAPALAESGSESESDGDSIDIQDTDDESESDWSEHSSDDDFIDDGENVSPL